MLSMFPDYTLFTSQSINGVCSTTSFPSTFETPFTVTHETAVASSDFSSSAIATFLRYIGFTRCEYPDTNGDRTVDAYHSVEAINITTSRGYPTGTISSDSTRTNSSIINSTRAFPPNSASGSDHTNTPIAPGISQRVKIAIGCSVSVAGLISFLVLALWIYRYRKAKQQRQPSLKSASPEDDQPYLQRKGELEAEEKHRYELSNEQRQNELDGDNEIHEMPADRDGIPRRQELRGEEHCKELGARNT